MPDDLSRGGEREAPGGEPAADVARVAAECDLELQRLALGRLDQGGAPSVGRPRTWRHPELVVVAPCGFDHERAAREAGLLPVACRAVAVDSNAYYARPAPRLADGIAQLAFLIHPDLVDDPGLPYVELAIPTPPATGDA